MHIPILIAIKNGGIIAKRHGRILIFKNVLFKVNFQYEGHLDGIFLIFALSIHGKCLLF